MQICTVFNWESPQMGLDKEILKSDTRFLMSMCIQAVLLLLMIYNYLLLILRFIDNYH